MFKELINRLCRPMDKYSDGASVFYGHRECVCYRDSPRRSIEFDIEDDGDQFIVIPTPSYWEGELSGKIDNNDLNKIRERIGQYFKKRGIVVELR